MGWKAMKTLEGLTYYYNADNEDIQWEKPEELQTREEREHSKGEWTWVPHSTDLWQPARREKTNADGSVDCLLENGRHVVVPASRIMDEAHLTGGRKQEVPLWQFKSASLIFEEDDLVMLDQLNEAMIITNLRQRYQHDKLYTWVGAARSVLISVNPYKKLPLYGNDKIDLYRFRPPNTKLDPHVFDIANDSYNSLLFEGRNQSILISGESGAGKTVATKQCLSFLARVAGSERNVEERVILANPLLEAFGNAQTIRNNNSSRFGKWIQVYFDPLKRAITSAEIINYLLEKSRLVYQQAGERNYHVFYQLTKDSKAKAQFGLEGPKSYRYTNVSGCFDAKDIDDVESYDEVNVAMHELGFSQEERNFLLGCAAAILKLGNCEFAEKKEANNVMGSKLKNDKAAKDAAQLFGVDANELIKVLSYRSITVRGAKSVIPLDPEKARASCDSLSMGIYGKLFNWLVRKVNVSLEGDKNDKKTNFIGILDIFGFEIFDQNSFEQLCINFCNEKLQQQFNKTTFKEEEELYRSEGIKFTHVEFIDNQIVLDMIEKPPKGILPLLDDECILPEGTDTKFMNKIEDTFKSHEKFQTDVKRKLDNTFNFEIVHYAGIVKYNGDGFMVKNRDSMFPDQQELCNNSKNEFMQQLFTNEGGSGGARATNIKSKGQKSLSYQFRNQLTDLMNSLYETDSRYIRCVKPNGKQVPNAFEAVMVNDQLRYSGVFEAVEIRKLGFPFRNSYAQFVCKYSCINMETRPNGKRRVVAYKSNGKRDPKGCVQEILSRNRYDFQSMTYGKTRILYKTKEHRMLTLLRELALNDLIPLMQAAMRGHLPREMKRRCQRADKELMKAMKIGNDIDALDSALNQVQPILGHLTRLFPGVLPSKYNAAVRHRQALQEWKDLEHIFDRLNKVSDPSQEDFEEMKESMEKGKSILDIPRTQRQISLFDEAVEQYNFMDIVIQNRDLETNLATYMDLMNYSKIRDLKSYTARVHFMKSAYETCFLTWQKSRLPNTMTQFELTEANKEEFKEAKDMLEFMKQYVGQRKGKDEPMVYANQLIQYGQRDSWWADEMWVQLLKFENGCPQEYKEKIWEMLAMAICCVKPSLELEKYVLVRLNQAPAGQGPNYISAYHDAKYNNGYGNNVGFTMVEEVRGHGRNRFSLRH